MMRHVIEHTGGGAVCSCGKEFNVWKQRSYGYTTSQDRANRINITRANARRHADAANKREGSK